MKKQTKNIEKGVQTDVKEVIDCSPLDTPDREDDMKTWNTLQFMCESDAAESKYESPKISQAELNKILKRAKSMKIGQGVLAAFR